jgi:hypothetical protein
VHPADPNPQPNTASERVLGPRPDSNDPMLVVARRANVGARLSMERAVHSRPMAPDPVGALQRRCEALEAACYHLFRLVDDADSLARDALERAGA